MRKALRVAGISIGTLLVLAVLVRGFMVWNQRRDVFPDFIEVPDGPRSPAFSLLGFTPGVTTLPEVQVWTSARGINCKDISMRALMREGREAVQREMARVEADGGDPDTVSGASRANYHSKKERNPQIKLYCGDIPVGKALGEEFGPTSDGSLTFVFDSEAHPLRYVMFDRKYQSNKATLEQWQTVLRQWSARLGAPSKSTEARPVDDGEGGAKTFPRLQLFKDEWRFADRRYEITAMNFGPPKGIDLRLIAEVPWPINVNSGR